MKEKKFNTGGVVTISVAHFIHDTYSSFFATLLPLLIEKLGIGYSLAGILTMVQRSPSLLNPFFGIIADKVKVRYLLIAAPTITAVSMSLLGMAPTYSVLVFLLFTMGIGSSLFHVPTPVMVKKISGDKVGMGMSFFMLGGEAARGVAPFVILGAVSLWGLEGTYRLIPVGIATSVFLYFRFGNVEISSGIKRQKQDGIWETFKGMYPFFVTLIFYSFFNSLIRASFATFLPAYVNDTSGDIWLGGTALAIYQISGAAGSFVAGSVSDKIGRKKILFFISAVTPMLSLAFIFSPQYLSLAILIVLGFIMLGTQPVLMALVNEVPSERPAFINSIYFTINFGTSAVAAFTIGVIADLLSLRAAFIICSLISLFTLIFIAKLPNTNSRV